MSPEETEHMETEKTKPSKPSAVELAEACAAIAYDRKAQDIIRMDLSELSAVADQFILCTGT